MMNENFNPVQTTPFSFRYKIKSRIWDVVNKSFFRWTPFFMRKTRVAILKVFGAQIEWNCSINSRARIVDPWNLKMGELSSVDEDCCLRCRDKIVIGKKCCISRGVDLLSGSHNIYSYKFEMITAPIVINDNVWIATKAMVGKGITIGEGAVIASYSNVIKNVEPWTVVGGNPAKFIKKRVLKNSDESA